MAVELKITEGIAPQEEDLILHKLRAFNIAAFGASDRRELAIPLYDENGKISGGLVGYTGRGWLYISMLYIPADLRGQGLATHMMGMAEEEARRRGCIGAYIDTMSPQALKLYQRLGYAEIGRLDALAGGHVVTWLARKF
ncbi:GNAT family N-acetyltransferase [Neorhizobium sp. NCHU2750]|uniref:GNAT family N-acetyltransferase n=1 Tax=Neorhizobium sp. NCHU2750 TaxID=1825976 RepID=UPI000E748CA0|nr:acetyltransferase [Neorhizobium sp. NCHU2750]